MHRALFVADQNVLDFVLLEQLIVEIQHCPAGIAENIFDPLLLKATHHDFSAA
jgi:hypothetical protein